MARIADRLPDNADGEFFVDSSCIDCAVCRNVAPRSFGRSDRVGASIVTTQPESPARILRAKMALVSCPTSSIGSRSKLPVNDAIDAFPEPLGEGIHFCGFASESSYGAQSYLIVRPPELGNVLVDSPRATPRLMERIEELGGVRFMFLTHRDDVADHAKFARRFGCTRMMHAADIGGDTRDIERPLFGNGDGDADGDREERPIPIDRDLLIIPTPGHTRGSASLLFRDFALFTGDHLFATEDGDALYASRSVCWHSWDIQKRSLEKLLAFDFLWVLPGHEGRLRAPSIERMREHLQSAIVGARRHSR